MRKRQLHNILELFQGCVLAGDVGIANGGNMAGWLGCLGLSVKAEYQVLFFSRLLGLDAERLFKVDCRVR